MKTLKLFSLLIITGFITMSMGFPIDIANGKNKQGKTPAHTNANKSTAMQAVKAEEPIQQFTKLLFSTTSSITVKVFDVKGALVMKEEVTMDEFLGKSKKANRTYRKHFCYVSSKYSLLFPGNRLN
jgi:hypothetical protein